MLHIFAGMRKHHKIIAPEGPQTRPSSGRLRETVFNICQTYVQGAEFLDLFAGSGAMGLEALSREAAKATFIDGHKECIKCIQQNVQRMHFESRAQILQGDVFLLMEKLIKQERRFDLIFADPPYETWTTNSGEKTTFSQHLLSIIDQSPLLRPSGVLFIEESRTAPPNPAGLQNLILHRSRNMGRTTLQEYRYAEKNSFKQAST
jgi:16S rRNA (guanine966-N2)-methyltransferase